MSQLARRFAEDSARLLTEVYLPRFERALERLPAEDLWWRPNPDSMAVGTVLLHLEGNVRQWILSAIGGAPDQRDREAEFAAADGPSAEELFGRLSTTVRAAADTIRALDEQRLLERVTIRGDEVDLLWAVYHVVEHFGWHTAQAV